MDKYEIRELLNVRTESSPKDSFIVGDCIRMEDSVTATVLNDSKEDVI